MPVIVDWEQIDPEKDFKYGTPKQTSTHGGFSLKLEVVDPKTGNLVPFVHQAPPLSIPFGLTTKETANGTRYQCVLSFPTVRFDKTDNKFYGEERTLKYMNFIDSIDKNNKKKAFSHCKEWFKKEQTEAVIDELYFHNLYIGEKAREGEYSPTFTTKIPYGKNGFITEFYLYESSTTQTQIEFDEVGKCYKAIPLLETTGLWFAGKQFGMSFRVVQLLVFKEDRFVGCAINTAGIEGLEQVERPLAITDENTDDTNTPRETPEEKPKDIDISTLKKRRRDDDGVETKTSSRTKIYNP